MGFLKQLFGGKELSPEEEQREQEQKNFDLLKYDGVKAMRIGKTDYAVRCFQEALKLRDDLEVHDYLAQTFLRMGDLEAALSQYEQLAAAEPENAALWLQLAHVAYMQEDYDRMAQASERAIALDGERPQAHFMLAKAHLGRGNDINAIAVLTKCIALDENYGDAYLLRGQTLLRMGDVGGAEADADYLLAHVGEHEDVLLLKARVAKAKGQTADALVIYNKVVEVNPFIVEAYKERGQIKFEQGDTAGAREDADKVLELDPQQLADVSGDYSAEGIEHKTRQAYSNINPFGI